MSPSVQPALRIATARTRLRSPVPIAPARLAAWERGFAALDGQALAGRWVRPGEWLLIRRLPLQLRWRSDAGELAVGTAWSGCLERAIAEAVERHDDNCLRYRDHREALADLVYRSALGDCARQWAWQRMDLIPRAGLSPDEALHCALRLLARQPEQAWPLLLRLLQAEPTTAAFTATLRAQQGSLLPALLRLCPRSAPYLQTHAPWPGVSQPPYSPDSPDSPDPRDSTRWPGPPTAFGPGLGSTAMAPVAAAPVWPPLAQDLIGWARTRAALAWQHREALAALLAAIAWPAPGASAHTLQHWLDHAQRALQAATASAAVSQPVGQRESAVRAVAPLPAPLQRAEAAPARTLQPKVAPPDLPTLNPDTGQPTHWGGALFWLTRLGPAWQALAPQPELAELLRETARSLGVPAHDPALRAFCGGAEPAAELPPCEATTEVATPDVATPNVAASARSLVAGWEAWLQQAAPELPEPRVAAVCQRSGRLVLEPGWISLHLPLHAVDTSIRRLGLDLDPGWLPWLGCVVRVCYDDA